MREVEVLLRETDGLLILLILASALVLLGRFFNIERFQTFISLPFSNKQSGFSDGFNPTKLSQGQDIIVSIAAIVSITSCVFWLKQINLYTEFASLNDHLRQLQISFVLVAFFLLKNLISTLIGEIFGQREIFLIGQNRSFAYLAWAGVLLMPILFLALYLQQFVQFWFYLILVLLLGAYILSSFQLHKSLWKTESWVVYKLLYLCTLEIIPILHLLRWIKSL